MLDVVFATEIEKFKIIQIWIPASKTKAIPQTKVIRRIVSLNDLYCKKPINSLPATDSLPPLNSNAK